MDITIALESWGQEITLDCEVDHTPAERESRDCPGSGAENDITKVLRDGEDITGALSDEEWERLAELVDEEVADVIDTAAENAHVDRYLASLEE